MHHIPQSRRLDTCCYRRAHCGCLGRFCPHVGHPCTAGPRVSRHRTRGPFPIYGMSMPGYSRRWQTISAKAKAYYIDHPHLELRCWLCGRGIDPHIYHNDALAFTLDHIVPKRHGGQDIRSNAMPAHRACNTSRRHRDHDIPIRSRSW